MIQQGCGCCKRIHVLCDALCDVSLLLLLCLFHIFHVTLKCLHQLDVVVLGAIVQLVGCGGTAGMLCRLHGLNVYMMQCSNLGTSIFPSALVTWVSSLACTLSLASIALTAHCTGCNWSPVSALLGLTAGAAG
jgi:hypothetical protein